MEDRLERRNRVFTLVLVTFSAVWLLCSAVNLVSGSAYDYVSGLSALGISALGVLIGLLGFRLLQTRHLLPTFLYTLTITAYAFCFLTSILVLSILEYQDYLESHSWELKTSISLVALGVFFAISMGICGFGSWIAIRLLISMKSVRTKAQELEPIVERQEEGLWGGTSRNPLTPL